MSGPIVRKYGFPNFEKIFGDREIKHGAEPPKPGDEPGKPEVIAPGTLKPADPRVPDEKPRPAGK